MRNLRIKPKFKKPLILCISVLLVALFSVLLLYKKPNEEVTYYVGIVENIQDDKLVIMKSYEEKLQAYETFEYTYYPSVTSLLEAMNRGMVDIGFVDAYSLSKTDLNESLSIIASQNITLESDEPQNYYRSILLKKEDITETDEIIRKNVDYQKLTYCVMNPTSIAGFIGVMPFFEEYDFDFHDVRSIIVNGFEDSLIKLADGTCDIGVGYTNIREEYEDMWEYYYGSKASIYDELSIIYVSERIYDDAVIISKKINDTFKKQFLELLYENNYSDSRNENYDYLKESINKYLGGK